MALVTDYPICNAYDHDHEIILSSDYYEENRVDILTWLIDNFGYDEDTGLWDLWEWAQTNKAYFTFLNEQDAMAFKLAWCN